MRWKHAEVRYANYHRLTSLGTQANERQSRVPVVHLHPFFPIHPDGVLDILKIITSTPGAAQIGSLGHKNFTMITPSLILPTTIPILTIRNPHLVVPSAVRTMAKMGIPQGGGRANLLVTTSNIWNVAFYEYFTARGIKPVVVDADDYMTDPNFVERLCKRVGLEVGELQMEWEANRGGEGLHEMYYASQKTLVESERMLPQRAGKSVDIEMERQGWKEEFGDDLGLIEEAVDLTMEWYEWLHERRFR